MGNAYLKTPLENSDSQACLISISDEALEQVAQANLQNDELKNEILDENEESWFKKAQQLEKDHNEEIDVSLESFDKLHNSISQQLQIKSRYRYGEYLKEQVQNCYKNSPDEPLNCSQEADRFSVWLIETRKLLIKNKTNPFNELLQQ